MRTETITITVDGKPISCRPGELLIEVAKRGGIYVPYFCYHPRMDPVGACRMCLVEVQPGPPKPQTACTTRVNDGMQVRTQFSSPEISEAQQGMLEFLLINHPLDCPICDRGGECPLQDQTQDYGPNESRFIEPKRRFRKPVAISSLIKLDRERCILCYRCTRFCEELSGDTMIGVMERGPQAYIYPYGDSSFDSYFSGNTVQICPVGALTSSSYRFKARPWDLQNVTSTCNLCASGCSIDIGVRVQDGNVARFSAATNEQTNEEWLCDKGRYGNAYISDPSRLTQPMIRREDALERTSWDDTFDFLTERLGPVFEGGRGTAAGMIVGGSLCDEDYYTAQKFARSVLRTNAIDHRLDGRASSGALIAPELTYDDVLGSDLVVLVGLDAREELPIVFLRLRIAATKRGVRVAIVHPRRVALSELAASHIAPIPGAEGSVGEAVAAAVAGASPGDVAGADAGELDTLTELLRDAERPVVLLGDRMGPEVLGPWKAAAEATGARVAWLPRRANTYGALAAGAHPDLLPGWRSVADDGLREQVGRRWGVDLPSEPGLDVADMLGRAARGGLKALWLMGADLDDVPGDAAGEALAKAGFVVVQDVQDGEQCAHADAVLPAAAFVEREGTLTDWEGRRQASRAATDPPGAARADYAILAETARRLGRPIGCRTATEARAELDALLEGAVLPRGEGATEASQRAAPSSEYPLRLLSYPLLYDAGSRLRRAEGIAQLTPSAFVEINPSDAGALRLADGDRVRVSSAHGRITAPARVSDTIRTGVVFVPYSQPGAGAKALCTWGDLSPAVKVERA